MTLASAKHSSGLLTALVAVATALTLLCAPCPATAWGFEGHRLTALVANHFLMPETASAIDKFLGAPLWKKTVEFPQVRHASSLTPNMSLLLKF